MLLIQCISEFFGTGLIIFFNSSYIASLRLTHGFNNSWKISVILGLSTCIAIYLSLFISGAHLNPIITLSFFLFFNFNKKKIIPYILSQILGSFCFSAIVYKLYYDLLIKFEAQNKILRGSLDSLNLASIFSCFPNKNISMLQIFIIETIITFIFILIIIFLNDHENFFVFKITFSPILVGILVFLINFIVSPFTNFILNPAHDIGSRTFIYLSGWGKIVFTNGSNITHFFIPILGTMLGSVMSVYFYKYIKKYIFCN
ncbi:MAG: MIP/aquaporin family protein [Buchnera aphidicola (Meitanaphis elongallis)]